MRTLRLTALGVILACAGCGSAPQKHDFDKSRTVTQTYDQTWEDIVNFFASRNIPVKNIAKDSGVIYAETMSIDPSLADCGKLGMGAVVIGAHGNFNVFVKRGQERQVVTVTSQFQQTEQSTWDKSVFNTACTSTGMLERQILDSLSTQ